MTIPDLWVMSACVIGGFCVAAGAFSWARYRLEKHAAGMRRRYEARLAEQDRIARDMHDWLLQSTQGLMLRFQAVSSSDVLPSPTRLMLERTLDQADRFIDQERSLLAPECGNLDPSIGLVAALNDIGRKLSDPFPETFHATLDGGERSLEPAALRGACRIFRDLLIGAYAQPPIGNVEVKVSFARTGLNVRLCVDSMASGSALAAARLGACALGATLDVWRRLGAGTEIDLHVPASIAYRRRSTGLSRWGFDRLVVADS